jgi:sulfatase maturation enzyme AslB (radical SAM superfamily)
MKTPTGSWCVLPWIHLFACEEGFLRPCCMALEDRDIVNRDSNGEPYVVYGLKGIEEAWNSEFMRSLRRDMMAGERPPVCSRCFRDEDLGIRSYRLMSNDMFRSHVAEALENTSDDGTSPSELIRSVDLRLGNLCNLRCRMCSPISTKALIHEWADLHGIARDNPELERLRKLDWFAQDDFWLTFQKYVPHIERLHFAGGEPLLVTQMFDFLERIIEMGHAPNITLSYVTNLTVLPRRIYDLWPRFKRISMTASLDGFGEVNSYIRYPSQWPTIDRNLMTVDSNAEQLNCHDGLTFNATVQAYNILRLDEFVEYTATAFQRFGRPKLSLLYYPEHFSIQILPQEIKQIAAARLRSFKERFAGRWPERWRGKELNDLLSTIDGIIDYMMGADRSDLLPEFRRWTEHMDTARGQKILDVIPELAPIF